MYFESLKAYGRVKPVSEFRREKIFYGTLFLAGRITKESNGIFTHLPGTGICCHNNDDITKICSAPGVVGQGLMVHHLQENGKYIRVRFFNFIKQ